MPKIHNERKVHNATVQKLERLFLLEDGAEDKLAICQGSARSEGLTHREAVLLGLFLSMLMILVSVNLPEINRWWHTYQGVASFQFAPGALTDRANHLYKQANPFALIHGLSAQNSEITGIVDPDSLTASYYWTFVLKNETKTSQEAKMQIALPEGAVVSRATLWVNGQPEEASFSSTEQVQRAYDWIVSRNRDPLLITHGGVDRVLVKAAPVLPGGREMKFRVGITAPITSFKDGLCEIKLPHVVKANFSNQTGQNVHIESGYPIHSGHRHVSAINPAGDYFLRANIDARELKTFTIATRRADTHAFATRATHSAPPSFIVATVDSDPNSARQNVTLARTFAKPTCRIIKSEATAHRLSTLWAYREVERLADAGITQQAVDVATIYRVVSSVSGATVLEQTSDYTRNGLNRDMYRNLTYDPGNSSYIPQTYVPKSTAGESSRVDSFSTAPELQGATNGTIGLMGGDATVIHGVNTAGTIRVNNSRNIQAGQAIGSHPGGPIGSSILDWSSSSSRDANLFSDGSEAVAPEFDYAAMVLTAAIVCAGVFLNLAGGVTFIWSGVIRIIRRQNGAAHRLMAGCLWLVCAIICPLVSQALYVLRIILAHKRRKRLVHAL